jgi:hypothetical protein
MTASTLKRIVAIGIITGMRSMAGAASVAARHGGVLRGATALLAAGEMIADKTTVVGNRTDPLPLMGRAVIGGGLGGLLAWEEGDSVLLGGVLGASAAIAATHLAYQLRKRLAGSTVAGGLIEDAIVFGAGSLYANRA